MICDNVLCDAYSDGKCGKKKKTCFIKNSWEVINDTIYDGDLGTQFDKLRMRAWVSDIVKDWDKFKAYVEQNRR